MANTEPRSFLVTLLLCLFGIAACREQEVSPPTATTPRPRVTKTTVNAPRVVPDAAQLVRSYQGRIDKADGKSEWLRVQITAAQATGAEIAFEFTINNPDHREDSHGSLDREGRVRLVLRDLPQPLTGVASVKDDSVILESEAIEGPPYWHLVGHAPAK
jgi:hypothetical protein